MTGREKPPPEPTRGYVEDHRWAGSGRPVGRMPQVKVTGVGVTQLVTGGSMVVVDGRFRGEDVLIPLDADDVEAIASAAEWQREHDRERMS